MTEIFKFYSLFTFRSESEEKKNTEDETSFNFVKEKETGSNNYVIQKQTESDLRNILMNSMSSTLEKFANINPAQLKANKAKPLPSNSDSHKRSATNFESSLNFLILKNNSNMTEIKEKIIEECARFSKTYKEILEFDGVFIGNSSFHHNPLLPVQCIQRIKLGFSSLQNENLDYFYVFSEAKSSLKLQKEDVKKLEYYFKQPNYLKSENDYWKTLYKFISIIGNFMAKGKNYIDFLKAKETIPRNAIVGIHFLLFYNGEDNQHVENFFKKDDQRKLFQKIVNEEWLNKIPNANYYLSIYYVTVDAAFSKVMETMETEKKELKKNLEENEKKMENAKINMMKDLLDEGKNDKEIWEKLHKYGFETSLEKISEMRAFNNNK